MDDTIFGAGGTNVFVRGNGTIVYNGTTDYQGDITINNANLKVNGVVSEASVNVCRNSSFSAQRGKLSGIGTLTGNVFANSGTISPDHGGTLSLGALTLTSANTGSLGSLVHIEVDSVGTSSVAVSGAVSLAGTLEIAIAPGTAPGRYTILTSSGITGTFDNVTFTGAKPRYTVSYLPVGAPTYVQLNYIGPSRGATPPVKLPAQPTVDIPATLDGATVLDPAVICCGRPVILGPLPIPGTGPTTYAVTAQTGNVTCQIGQTATQTYLKVHGSNGSCTIVGTKNGITSKPLTITAP
jgi:hypothetical protein